MAFGAIRQFFSKPESDLELSDDNQIPHHMRSRSKSALSFMRWKKKSCPGSQNSQLTVSVAASSPNYRSDHAPNPLSLDSIHFDKQITVQSLSAVLMWYLFVDVYQNPETEQLMWQWIEALTLRSWIRFGSDLARSQPHLPEGFLRTCYAMGVDPVSTSAKLIRLSDRESMKMTELGGIKGSDDIAIGARLRIIKEDQALVAKLLPSQETIYNSWKPLIYARLDDFIRLKVYDLTEPSSLPQPRSIEEVNFRNNIRTVWVNLFTSRPEPPYGLYEEALSSNVVSQFPKRMFEHCSPTDVGAEPTSAFSTHRPRAFTTDSERDSRLNDRDRPLVSCNDGCHHGTLVLAEVHNLREQLVDMRAYLQTASAAARSYESDDHAALSPLGDGRAYIDCTMQRRAGHNCIELPAESRSTVKMPALEQTPRQLHSVAVRPPPTHPIPGQDAHHSLVDDSHGTITDGSRQIDDRCIPTSSNQMKSGVRLIDASAPASFRPPRSSSLPHRRNVELRTSRAHEMFPPNDNMFCGTNKMRMLEFDVNAQKDLQPVVASPPCIQVQGVSDFSHDNSHYRGRPGSNAVVCGPKGVPRGIAANRTSDSPEDIYPSCPGVGSPNTLPQPTNISSGALTTVQRYTQERYPSFLSI